MRPACFLRKILPETVEFQFVGLTHEVEYGKLKVENEGVFFENIFK